DAERIVDARGSARQHVDELLRVGWQRRRHSKRKRGDGRTGLRSENRHDTSLLLPRVQVGAITGSLIGAAEMPTFIRRPSYECRTGRMSNGANIERGALAPVTALSRCLRTGSSRD